MPRYFVDVAQDGEIYDDYYGMELAGMSAIRKEVEATIREIASEIVRSGRRIGESEIRVRNSKGQQVLVLKFRDVVL